MNSTVPASHPFTRRLLLATASVFAMFFAFSTIRAPVPAVNEPHFLCKAKHYWDSAWCPGDFYLDSSNAHLVFFQTAGWLAQWVSLPATAWIGRLIALGLLAGGWTALVRRLLPGEWAAVWTASLFLLFASIGNLSGEWVLGGIEAKVIAYACVFFAVAKWIDRRWISAGAWGGVAIAFHPVVGLWSLFAAVFATIAGLIVRDASDTRPDVPSSRVSKFIGLALLVLLALPGLWPAVSMLDSGSEEVRDAAGYLQVGIRLSHHLDPMLFSPWAWAGYAILTILWIAGCFGGAFRGERDIRGGRHSGARKFAWFTGGALLFALGGLLVGWREEPLRETRFLDLTSLDMLRIRLLRFYSFRLYDMFAPLAASVAIVGFVQRGIENAEETRGRMRWRFSGIAVGFVALFAGSLLLPAVDRNASGLSANELRDWTSMCRWIETDTPVDAEFVTPDESWAFQWFAQRAEYVSWKNCPQDAPGIIEWNRRFRVIHRWATGSYDDRRYDAAELRSLHEKTGADYLLTNDLGPMTVPPVHANDTYRLYRLNE